MKNNNPIYVTRPSLPDLEEFIPYLRQIWENKILTNNGPFHQEFEMALAKHLGVKYVSAFANGTLALIVALQALRITGEVITTPFSFVATTHSMWWNGIKPVFADIEPDFLNLDPERVEAKITPQTTAILPVHVYGNPCNLKAFEELANRYGLKLIYDAAHAFGVRTGEESILNFGDLSILSFHATKVFNTIEGGAIICHDEKTKKRVDYLKNFGFANETTVVAPGINAKLNEIQSAFGLLQLEHISGYIKRRETLDALYREELKNIPGIEMVKKPDNVTSSFSYFPILVDKENYGSSRDQLYEKLKQHNVFARRYFYPLISQFPTYRGLPSASAENLPVATKISERVICLPIYSDLSEKELRKITSIIRS